jgi:hypothetical protein
MESTALVLESSPRRCERGKKKKKTLLICLAGTWSEPLLQEHWSGIQDTQVGGDWKVSTLFLLLLLWAKIDLLQKKVH